MQKIIRIRRIQSSDRKELWGAVQNEKLLGKGSGNKEVILSQKKKKKTQVGYCSYFLFGDGRSLSGRSSADQGRFLRHWCKIPFLGVLKLQ